jgi:hypothetical protein
MASIKIQSTVVRVVKIPGIGVSNISKLKRQEWHQKTLMKVDDGQQ